MRISDKDGTSGLATGRFSPNTLIVRNDGSAYLDFCIERAAQRGERSRTYYGLPSEAAAALIAFRAAGGDVSDHDHDRAIAVSRY